MVAGNDFALAFLRWANLAPDRIALTDGRSELDYAALSESIRTLAGLLRNAGVLPGDVVAVACDRSVDSVVSILSVLYVGAAYLPLDLSYPQPRLQQMVEDAQPRLVLAGTTVPVDRLQSLQLPVVSVASLAGPPAPLDPPAAVDAGSPAYVLFTSGSTGRPKGALLSRRALQYMVSWHVGHPRLGTSARTLQFATLGFDSSVRDLFATFATGGTLVMAAEVDRRDPFRLLALIRAQNIERMFVPYVALRALAQAHAEGGALPGALRDVMTGGEALTITGGIRGLFQALPDAVLYNEYGPTESCVFVTSHALQGDPAQWPERPPIGSPLGHVLLHVADDQLQLVADGTEGELLIGGESLADGYLHQPELSAERFVWLHHQNGARERVYRSGDRVRREMDGRITFLGRVDDQVKIAGYRVELGEVEAVLNAHPAISAAAVVAVQGSDDRRLVAHVVAAPGARPLAELRSELDRHLADGLPPFARPQRLVFSAALPQTPNGKIDRRRLEAESVTKPVTTADANVPLEDLVVALWRELLDRPALGATDNVFDCGASSLVTMSFVTRLRAAKDCVLAASAVYEFPTPRQQAQELSRAVAETVAPVVRVQASIQRNALERLRQRKRDV